MDSVEGNATSVNVPTNSVEEEPQLKAPLSVQQAAKVKAQMINVTRMPSAAAIVVVGRCGLRLRNFDTLANPAGKACPNTAVSSQTLLRRAVYAFGACLLWGKSKIFNGYGCCLRQFKFAGGGGGCVFTQLFSSCGGLGFARCNPCR